MNISRRFGFGRRVVMALGLASAIIASPPLHARPSAPEVPAQVASTPPMGWNPFNAFRLAYDEADVMRAAQAMIGLGFRQAGYRYVNIDDGWWLRREGRGITVRTNLFPSARMADGSTSLRPFVAHIHALGLKAGIYTDIGYNTCSQQWDKASPNLPEGTQGQREVGAMGHNREDADLFFRQWGFDFVKVDGCGVADYAPSQPDVHAGQFRAVRPLIVRDRPQASDPQALAALHAAFSRAARDARPGAPPVFAICAWGDADVNDWGGRYGHMWRTSADIRKSWPSMLHNFDSAAPRALFAGPGRWNDPDLLEIGNGDFDEQHLVEARAHMAMWAIIAAPLMLSYDLTRASPAIHAIALNRDVIAIDQDPAGNQGVIIRQDDSTEIIVKQLTGAGRKAVALINRSAAPIELSISLADLKLMPSRAASVKDVWSTSGARPVAGRITRQLAPHETALLLVQGMSRQKQVVHPAEMPARISVIEPGYKPDNRSTRPEHQWIPARISYRPNGRPILSGAAPDRDAIGAATGSLITIALNAEFRTLRVTPQAGDAGGVYTLSGDGRRLHAAKADGQQLVLSVAGMRTLTLQAPDGGAGDFIWGHFSLER